MRLRGLLVGGGVGVRWFGSRVDLVGGVVIITYGRSSPRSNLIGSFPFCVDLAWEFHLISFHSCSV